MYTCRMEYTNKEHLWLVSEAENQVGGLDPGLPEYLSDTLTTDPAMKCPD